MLGKREKFILKLASVLVLVFCVITIVVGIIGEVINEKIEEGETQNKAWMALKEPTNDKIIDEMVVSLKNILVDDEENTEERFADILSVTKGYKEVTQKEYQLYWLAKVNDLSKESQATRSLLFDKLNLEGKIDFLKEIIGFDEGKSEFVAGKYLRVYFINVEKFGLVLEEKINPEELLVKIDRTGSWMYNASFIIGLVGLSIIILLLELSDRKTRK